MSGVLWNLLMAEIALTVAVLGMFLLRSFLDMKEEDHLVLDDAEAHLMRDQAVIRRRMGVLSKYIKMVGVAWSLLAVVILGVWVLQGLSMI